MVYVLGVASAFFYGLASVLQHREAAAAPQAQSLRLGLLAHLLRRPLWAAGIAADAAAFVLQGSALSRGPLVLVQPLLTAGLLFALALSAALERRRIAAREWVACLALIGGLTLLLWAESPAEGRLVVPFHRWIVGGAFVAVTSLGLVAWARWTGSRLAKPILLGIAAAITFAMTNALLKSAVDVLTTRGIVEVLDGWYLYALIGLGGVGLLLVQSAFQAGPLRLSLPALTAVEPVASSAVGVILFAEHIRSDPAALVFEALAAALIVFGVWVLGRSPIVTGGSNGGQQGMQRQQGQEAHEAAPPQSLPARNPAETGA
jgi:drug/metabolite transporter (DMT)-like permease